MKKTNSERMETIKNNCIKTIFLLTLLLTSASCEVDKGKPAIDREKMCDILVDAYIADATLRQASIPSGNKREYYYCHVLEKHGVSEAIFDSALTWSSKNLDEYQILQDSVIARLNREKSEIENAK